MSKKPCAVVIALFAAAGCCWTTPRADAQVTQVDVDNVLTGMGSTTPVPATRLEVAIPGLTQEGAADLASITGAEDLVFIEALVVEVDYDQGLGLGVMHEYLQKTAANPNPQPSDSQVRNEPANPADYAGPIAGERGDVRNAQARFPLQPNLGTGLEINTRTDLDDGVLYSTLQALVNDGKARVLAKPSITTVCGFTARINTGEILPFLSTTSNVYGNLTTVTEFKNVGLQLSVTPNVIYLAGQGRTDMISMKATFEDSTVTRYRMEGEFPVPIVDVRRQDTEVIVRSGETFMMSGLLRSRLSYSKRGIPYLMDVPVVDVLSSKRENFDLTTELVVTIKPTIVESRVLDLADNIGAAKAELEYRVRELDAVQNAVRENIHQRASGKKK